MSKFSQYLPILFAGILYLQIVSILYFYCLSVSFSIYWLYLFPKVLCHIQVSISPMTIFTDKLCTLLFYFSAADCTYRTYIVLLHFGGDDSLLPALVFQFFPNGIAQSQGRCRTCCAVDDPGVFFVVFWQNQDADVMFLAVVNDLSAELMCIVLMKIFQFHPIAMIGPWIIALTS